METQTLDIPVVWPEYYSECDSCLERLRQTLAGLTGVRDIDVNSDGHTIEVTYDKDLLTFDDIRERARLLGVDVGDRYTHNTLRVGGLDCPDCALKLETAVRRMRGVLWASLNYATGNLVVELDPSEVDIDAVKNRVREFGYYIEEESPTGRRSGRTRPVWNLRTSFTVISGLLMAAGGAAVLARSPSIASGLFIASALIGGVFAARAGFLSLRGLSLDTNFLMTAAAAGAIALGEYWEAAAVMFLFSLGSTLEAHTVDKARRSIRSLIESFPASVSVKRGGEIVEVALEDVVVGETALIKPGDRIAIDGTVTEGSSWINEAPITGEPTAKDKGLGDFVYAGSINGTGSLEVRVTSAAEDNTLARIVHMVEQAQSQKAPSQRFSETFGRVYTPIVIGLAVAVAVGGSLFLGGGAAGWVKMALTLLVVSCPCALVISTPVAVVAAIGSAAKSGVLIKGGAHLEALGNVSVVAFDKTGTLTTGKLTVCEVIPFGSYTSRDVLSAAASVESRSEHPLADAVLAEAREQGITPDSISYFEAYPGEGARAVMDGRVIYVGNRAVMERLEIRLTADQSAQIAPLLDQGCSLIYVCDERELLGAIAANDTLRPASAASVSALRSLGVSRTVLLTGDTVQAGAETARALNIDEAHGELLPQDKLALVRALSENANSRGADKVVMVGDGINDAPALAAAHIGVAMGGVGSPAAVEAADVALMADDIVMLPYALALGRKAGRVIRQNVFFAIAVVLALVSGALTGKVNLATGVLGHEASALLVIGNSMRLLRREENGSTSS